MIVLGLTPTNKVVWHMNAVNFNENEYININIQSELSEEEINKKIDTVKQGIFRAIQEQLDKPGKKDLIFTGKISEDNLKKIQVIIEDFIKGQFDNRLELTVTVQVKCRGLSHCLEKPFLARGEPNRKTSKKYYKIGEIVNPESDPHNQLIFLRRKMRGVEPGFEAIYARDLLPEGIFEDCNIITEDNTLDRKKTAEAILKLRHLNQGLQFIKLDYSKKPSQHTVYIPKHRAKNFAHRYGTSGSVQEKNESAIIEVLSNDVFRALGLPSQEAYLIKTHYRTNDPNTPGDAKYLVGCKCVTGIQGEKWTTLDGNMKHGQLIGNRLIGEDANGELKIYPLDEKQLTRAKNAQRLLGDRDGVGSKGANIGYFIDSQDGTVEIINIDPGKSLENPPEYSPEGKKEKAAAVNNSVLRYVYKKWLSFYIFVRGETDRMRFADLQTDCTFKRPHQTLTDKLQHSYVNFSIFDDTTLVENIGAMKELIQNRDAANVVFEEYEKEFANTVYLAKIQTARLRFNERLNDFQRVLGERLERSDQELNLLESLEKLTSRTTNIAGKGKEAIALRHLKILPHRRHEWKIREGKEGSIIFYCPVKSWLEKRRVSKRLEALSKENTTVNKNIEGEISFEIPKDEIGQVQNWLNEQAISAHKNQKLFPEDGKFSWPYPFAENFDLTKEEDLKAIIQEMGTRNFSRQIPREERKEARKIVRSAIQLQLKRVHFSLEKTKGRMAPEDKTEVNNQLRALRKEKREWKKALSRI